MSSCESEKSYNRRQASWSSSGYSFSDSMHSSIGGRDYSTGGSSRSAGTDNSSHALDNVTPPCSSATLPELTQVPWTECEVLATLQKGSLRNLCGNVSIESLQRLAYLLQRPLVRIARETQRLSEAFNKCSKHEIRSACKIILSSHMYSEANKLASQSTLLYSMSSKNINSSKNSLCSLTLSVGKHHRWLLEALSVDYVHELAAVYMAAVMETIIEQTVQLIFFQDNTGKPS